MSHRIFLVEDERDLAVPLVSTMEAEGYEVEWFATGAAAVEAVRARPPHVLILDRRLPDTDGLDVCRGLRAGGYRGAIIMLSAQASEIDQVYGLNSGADDYVAKPFGVAQLLARIGAAVRRSGQYVDTSVGNVLTIERDSRRVRIGHHEVALSSKEFDILRLLDDFRGSVVTREQLIEEVWDAGWFGSDRVVDVAVGRLRQKLTASGAKTRITTVRGVGFRLDDDPESDS